MKTVACVASHVHNLIQHAGLRPVVGSMVATLLGGIMAAGSVVLSELLRPQVATAKELQAAEQRASQALKHETSLDDLPRAWLGLVAPIARSHRFHSLDGSDMSKPASRKLEFLDIVRDSSAKPRERVFVGPEGVRPTSCLPPTPVTRSKRQRRSAKAKASPTPKTRRARSATHKSKAASPAPSAPRARTATRKAEHSSRKAERKGERDALRIVSPPEQPAAPPTAPPAAPAVRVKFPSPPSLQKLGYWMVAIESGDGKGNHLPLLLEVFSTQDPAYQALGEDAWTKTFQRAMARVLEFVGRGGIWQLDRGFDDLAWMNWMHEHVDQYNIRLKKTRKVHPGTKDTPAVQVGVFAETLQTRHTAQVRYVNKFSHKAKKRTIPIAWAPVWIDGVDHPQYLVVGHTSKTRRLLLLTDVRPENAEEAGALLAAYLERWGNEETIRAVKQLTGLERIRVRAFPAIQRLVWLAMIAVGIQALMIMKHGRLTRAVLDRAKEFIKSVRYVIYRVWRVMREDLSRAVKPRSSRLRT